MENLTSAFYAGIDLIKSMEQLRDNPTPEGKRQFFTELKAARFLVPSRKQDNGIAILRTQNKEVFLPAFTTKEELDKWTFPQERIVVMLYDTLKHIAIDNPKQISGIVINPFGKALFLRHPQLAEIDAGTEGMTLKRVEHQGKLQLKDTTDYSFGLKTALEHLFEQEGIIRGAWILSAKTKGENNAHKLFVIDFDGDRKFMFPIVAKTIQPFMEPGETFELMKADDNLLALVQNIAKPIYQKRFH